MPGEVRELIRKISIANPLWGAPRIHGELLKLGIDLSGFVMYGRPRCCKGKTDLKRR